MSTDLSKFRNLRLPSTAPAQPTITAPAVDALSAPDWLSPAAKQEWHALAPQLLGSWRPKYENALAVYCVLMAHFKAQPENFGVARLAQLRGLAADLGLTPKASRLSERGR